MKNFLFPDFMFDSIYSISAERLNSAGVRALILDIDNTLVTYGEPEPDGNIRALLKDFSDKGFFVAIASNNKKERVELFNRSLGVFTVYKSGKPSRKAVRAVCSRFSVSPCECAVIGDQIFTDVLCAKRAGAKAFLVAPLPYKENLFFKFKRLCEKPLIRGFSRKYPDKCIIKGDERS